MIKGAIFDVDGTLLDSMPIWEQAGALYLESLNIQADPDLGALMYAMTMEEGATYLRQQYGVDRTADEIISGIHGIIRGFYYDEVVLKPGVMEFLTFLKKEHIRITAATSCDRPFVEAAFERLCIAEYFERIFTCTEIGAGKHSPDIFAAASVSMATVPSETWVFEDALHAILICRESGYKTVGVYDSSNDRQWEEIRRCADICIVQKSNDSDRKDRPNAGQLWHAPYMEWQELIAFFKT